MNNLNINNGVSISVEVPLLHSDSWFEPPLVIQAAIAPMNLIQVGAFTGIYGGKIGHCQIGRYCSIAPGVDIASDQHPIDWLSSSMIQYVPNIHNWGEWLKKHGDGYIDPTARFASNSTVSIGNDVWIGQGVFIKSGVKIGDGAVLAAHSVVIEDVPPYMIVAGVPAKIKKARFSDEIIQDLMDLKWWDFNIANIPNLDFKDVRGAIIKINELIESGDVLKYSPEKIKQKI